MVTPPNRSTHDAPDSDAPDSGVPNPGETQSGEPLTIVGIGASAGGLDALRRLFAAVPADSGMAWVVIMHLDPDWESQLPALLGRTASIPVRQVTRSVKVEADHVYVIPPTQDLTFVDGTVKLTAREGHATRAPIDLFFRALADAKGPGAVGVVLSGSGSDGTEGIRRIRELGGVTIVQEPGEAEFAGMPQSAIGSRQVDLVLAAAKIPAELVRMKRAAPRIEAGGIEEEPGSDMDPASPDEAEAAGEGRRGDAAALGEIFMELRTRTGHDFSHYKRSTVLRRITRRIRFTHLRTLPEYLDFVRSDPEEVRRLHRDLLISVSSFFRDPGVFEHLEKDVIPALFNGKGPDDFVRVWVAGCATGEEAYTLAMLVAEQAGTRADPPGVKIFATDIDGDALTVARKGYYRDAIADHVSAERLERFFEPENGGYRVKRNLRKMILFAEHDVLNDPPFSPADLISCRNWSSPISVDR
ncbi:hypothetical protein BH23GEM11_BH23GEM11_14370 [soil metagenome]